MSDYSKNFEVAMTGHTGPDTPITVKSGRTKLDEMADIRDLLSAIVGAGKGGLRPDDQSAVYARLGSILGKEKASKLINHILVFNQRADTIGKTAEQRINQFYDMGSSDSDLNSIIQKTKMLGEGPIQGAYQSVNDLTKKVYQGSDVKSVVSNNVNQEKLAGSLKSASGL